MFKSIVSILICALLTTGSALNLSAAHKPEPTVYSDLVNRPLDPLFDAYTYTSGKQVNLEVDQIAALKEIDPLDLLSALIELYQRFLNLNQYPNLSFSSLCDNFTLALDHANLNVPEERVALFEQIKQNLQILISEKRECTNVKSLLKEHPLCNPILADTTQLALYFLIDNQEQILSEISLEDYNKVVQTLTQQQKQAQKNKIIGVKQLMEKVMDTANKLNPIWDRVLQKNPDIKSQVDKRVGNINLGNCDMVRIFTYRIQSVTSLPQYIRKVIFRK